MGIDPQRRLDIIARIASIENDALFEQISQLVEQASNGEKPERIGKPLPNAAELLEEQRKKIISQRNCQNFRRTNQGQVFLLDQEPNLTN